MRNLLARALGEYGESEIPGAACNPRIGEFLRSVGLPEDDEIAWCSSFLYWCAVQENMERPLLKEAPSARSWLKVGTKILAPEQGDVVVLARGGGNVAGAGAKTWEGHVGLFIRIVGNKVYVLGGNQKNSVCISNHEIGDVLGYRLLSVYGLAVA